MSEKWAAHESRNGNELVARAGFNRPKAGLNYSVESFYALDPPPYPADLERLYRKKPGLYAVQDIGRGKLREVLNGALEPREALRQWSEEGNTMLAALSAEHPNRE